MSYLVRITADEKIIGAINNQAKKVSPEQVHILLNCLLFLLYLIQLIKCQSLQIKLFFQLQRQREEAKRRKKSQWTIMCVACGFFTSCLLLVAGMLSITSDYQVIKHLLDTRKCIHKTIIVFQDQAIARMLNLSAISVDQMNKI